MTRASGPPVDDRARGVDAEPSRLPSRGDILAAFRSSPFRYLWVSNFASQLVRGIEQFSFVWLTLEIADQSAAAGAAIFGLGFPIIILSLPAGAVSDRVERRRLLIGTRLTAAFITLVGAVLIQSGDVPIAGVLALALMLGSVGAISQPVRQAILPSVVEPERLLNAVVLVSFAQNISRLFGATLAGAVIALGGVGAVFLLQAATYMLAGLVLLPMSIPRRVELAGVSGPTAVGLSAQILRLLRDIAEGLVFVARQRCLRILHIMFGLSSFLMMGPLFVLLPVIARNEFGYGAFATSALFVFSAIGSMMMSVVLASLSRFPYKGGWLIGAMVMVGLATFGLGLSQWYATFALLLFVWGIGSSMAGSFFRTLVQSHAPDAVMGRVMSIQLLAIMGSASIGSLTSGMVADLVGATTVIAYSGLLISLVAVGTFLSDRTIAAME